MIILSHFQIKNFLLKRKEFKASLDLGVSLSDVFYKDRRFLLLDNQFLEESEIERIKKKKNDCRAYHWGIV